MDVERKRFRIRIQRLKPVIKQVTIHLMSKLTRNIRKLREKKGSDEQKSKNTQKADRLVEDIHTIKKLKVGTIICMLCKVNSEDVTNVDRIAVRYSGHEKIKPLLDDVLKDMEKWKSELPSVIDEAMAAPPLKHRRHSHKKTTDKPADGGASEISGDESDKDEDNGNEETVTELQAKANKHAIVQPKQECKVEKSAITKSVSKLTQKQKIPVKSKKEGNSEVHMPSHSQTSIAKVDVNHLSKKTESFGDGFFTTAKVDVNHLSKKTEPFVDGFRTTAQVDVNHVLKKTKPFVDDFLINACDGSDNEEDRSQTENHPIISKSEEFSSISPGVRVRAPHISRDSTKDFQKMKSPRKGHGKPSVQRSSRIPKKVGDKRKPKHSFSKEIAPDQIPAEELHPSWAAKRKQREQESAIPVFQGKRIKFTDD